MAAFRHGRHGIHEFRERELDHELPGRKDYSHGRYHDQDQGRDIRDCLRDRKRDNRESKQLNGYHRSTLISSNLSGDRGKDQKQGSLGSVDKEHGASGTGLDHPEASVLRVRDVRIPVLPSPNKKQKFSPVKCNLKKSSSITTIIGNVLQELVTGPQTFSSAHGYTLPHPIKKMQQSAEWPSPSTHLDLQWSNDREPGEIEVEEDEKDSARSIAASRWADCNDALEDNVEFVLKSHLAGQLSRENGQTPELGDVIVREGSEGATSNLFDSDGEHGDVNIIGNDDYMDISVKEDNGDASDHLSDTGSEADNMVRTQENPEQVQLPQRSINMLQGCRSVDEFEKMNRINEGTYGVVYKARDRKTGQIVALKKVKMANEREGFPVTSLREINILSSLEYRSVVGVKEVAVGNNVDNIFMVMEYMEHDLKGLMETMKQPFSQSEVKCLMLQLLEGVDYLHDNWVLHRDLKTSNLLMNNHGELKICDFGLSRHYGSPLKPYTQLVVTLWYRAPELLLGAKEYSTAIDMWSVGCIMAELLAKEPLFNGKAEFDQLDKIFRILGTPNEEMWPGFAKLPGVKFNFVKRPYSKLRDKFPPASFSGRPTLSKAGFDLLSKLLTYDPAKRISAKTALNHAWFCEIPLPKSKELMPTFSSQHAQDLSRFPNY